MRHARDVLAGGLPGDAGSRPDPAGGDDLGPQASRTPCLNLAFPEVGTLLVACQSLLEQDHKRSSSK